MAAPDVFDKNTANIKWKGKTFQQLCSGIKLNKFTNGAQTTGLKIEWSAIHPGLVMRALPLKIYRREIGTTSLGCNPRSSSLLRQLDNPGQTSVTQYSTDNSLKTTLDITYENNSCQHPTLTSSNEKLKCKAFQSQAENALRRVRSSGMIPKKSVNTYYTDTNQYLTSRNKTYNKAQYFYGTQGDTSSTNCNSLPIYYKPSNSAFSVQGGVSSSAQILRKKVDTINTAALSLRRPYGAQTANSIAYGSAIDSVGYNLKSQIGFPNIKIPTVNKYNSSLSKCVISRKIRNLRNG